MSTDSNPDIASSPLRATDADIRHAYRLLFGREPDNEGWNGHRHTIAVAPILAFDFARLLMDTNEFRRTLTTPPLIEVPFDGFSVFVRSADGDIGREIREKHSYEPHVVARLQQLLRPGMVFVDVGANIGFFTQLAASIVGPSGRVLAIEPLDKNVQLILRSLARNRFTQVEVQACAVSDRDGIASMITHDATSNGQATVVDEPAAALAQARTLDEITRDLAHIDVVKMDIEGFELAAWRGFRNGLATHRPHVLTEFHPRCMRRFAGVTPEDYLAEIFSYARYVEVVHVDGRNERCDDAAAVMRAWEAFDRATRGDGKSHLDLFVPSAR